MTTVKDGGFSMINKPILGQILNLVPHWLFKSLYYPLLSHYKSVLKQHHKTHIIKEIKGKVIKLIENKLGIDTELEWILEDIHKQD